MHCRAASVCRWGSLSLGQPVACELCARARVCVCVCVCVRVSVCVCFGVDALVRVSAVVLTGRRRRQLKQQEHPLHRSERQFCRGCRGSGPGLMIGRKCALATEESWWVLGDSEGHTHTTN